jgi:hypothetical protein
MSVDLLGKIFGSVERVKLLKLFLFRGSDPIDKENLASFARIPKAKLTKELSNLEKIGFIKKTSYFKEIKDKRKNKLVKKRVPGYRADTQFQYFKQLKQLLINTTPIADKELIKRLSKVGKLNGVIISGLFLQESDSIIDLLVVADEVKKASFNTFIKTLESEVGTTIRYTLLSVKDFKYRISMYDRLVRDVLDYEHIVIYDKLGIENY